MGRGQRRGDDGGAMAEARQRPPPALEVHRRRPTARYVVRREPLQSGQMQEGTS